MQNPRSAMIVPRGMGERTECNNYIALNFLSVADKIYARVIVNRVHKRTEEQEVFYQGGAV